MNSKEELAAGSEEEVEIRCCSIAAVEALRSALMHRCVPGLDALNDGLPDVHATMHFAVPHRN